MFCRCTTSSLRLFIRSVAPIDFPGPTCAAFGSSSRDIRDFASHGSGLGRSFPSKSYSTISPTANTSDKHAESKANPDSKYALRASDVKSKVGNVDRASVIASFSPEAIDAIASELLPPATSRTSEPQSQRSPAKQQREKDTGLEEQLSNIRPKQGKVENKGGGSKRSPGRTATRSSTQYRQDSRSTGYTANDKSSPPVEDDWQPPKKEPWQIQKAALKEKFPDGWNPAKRLSPDAVSGIRALHAQMPEKYTTMVLAEEFKVSVEAIRRILKSKWRPSADEHTNREMRWFRRGERVWSRYAELGAKPPRMWRDRGIGRGKPEWKKKGPQVIPSLVTTARPGDSNIEHQARNSGAGKSNNFEMPELITTAHPPVGH